MLLMSKDNKKTVEELFKDWTPEVVEYDENVDGGQEHLERDELLAEKETLKDEILKLKEKRRINKERR